MTKARRLRDAGVIAALVFLTACGGDPEYVPSSIDMGTAVVVADVDGDGRADVLSLVHHFGEPPVQGVLTVQRQTARGAFAAAERYIVGCYPWAMVLADVDGDGHPDLVVTDVSYSNCSDPSARKALYLLRQDPARPGRFLAPQKLVQDVYSYHAAVADLNGDGAPDIAFGQRIGTDTRLAVLYQDTARRGSFMAPVVVAAPSYVSQIVAGDIDGDGRADLFFTDFDPSSGDPPTAWLAVMTQTERGTLRMPTWLSSYVGVHTDFLAIHDLDGDGRADLLANFEPSSALRDDQPFLRTLRQGPPPLAWSDPIDLDLGGILGYGATALGDLNQDGRPDVVLAGFWPESGGPLVAPHFRSRVHLVFGVGGARFAYSSTIDVAPAPDAVAIGDLDGDGRNDIVLHADGAAWWMLQSATAPGSFSAPQPLP